MISTQLNPTQDIADIETALHGLTSIRADLVADSSILQQRVDAAHPNFRDSARNLLHYLALRRHDLRPLQLRLSALGLSSLGQAESHVLATVDSVLGVLHHLSGGHWQPDPPVEGIVDFARGQHLLAEHTDTLLGPATPGREVRIMVTMPTEAAEDYTLVHNLLSQGMDCLRINCAHDGPAAWLRMIEHVRRAERALGRSCRIVMDLAGPKLRTGTLQPGPAVVKIRPHRNALGKIIAPARVWLSRDDAPQSPPSPADASVLVPAPWLGHLRVGERVKLTDARDADRSLKIVDITERGAWAEADRTIYLIPDTVLRHDRIAVKREARCTPLGELPRAETFISLQLGDLLIVTRDQKPGRGATHDSAGRLLTPAEIGCTIPEVFEDVRSGESIWFDDGRIGGIVEKVEASQVQVRITQARLSGARLRGDKGINLPESALRLGALTAKDLEDLTFVAEHADVVELSFANSSRDVEQLQQHLARIGKRQPAIVLKIETARGFENLTDMLLSAMRMPSCGVMIARGDLAVECGFERLAEVQEEILWICEAAHVPVIWATQVLETLAREGIPSRAEITDAAMGHRAECVMLNKGPHVLRAVQVLDDILRRMQAHQAKKSSMLRELHLAHALPEATEVKQTGRPSGSDAFPRSAAPADRRVSAATGPRPAGSPA